MNTLPIYPRVAIVIVNWNKKAYILNLLKTLQNLDYSQYNIIVVDNASDDGSVESIKQNFPNIEVIVNKENLGGTGGFNTGLKHALKTSEYKYIWMLDNDVMVDKDALMKLVQVMEKDGQIGIAGSMILNPENKNLIVELGGHIKWNLVTWKPYLRNTYFNEQHLTREYILVDYVAACSALVRTEALNKAGIMDDRYFLHWDDIDLCLRISKVGYKVVAVSNSRVFHEVEKGLNPFVVYYDIRNGLLTISKHKNGMSKIICLFNMLRYTSKGVIFCHLSGMHVMGYIMSKAITDFIRGNFYKIKSDSNINCVYKPVGMSLKPNDLFKGKKRIIVFPNGSLSEIENVVRLIRHFNRNIEITLLIQEDRKNLFIGMDVDQYITFDSYKLSTMQTLKLLVKLFTSKFDCAISPSMSIFPFSYSVKEYYLFNREMNNFYKTKETVYSLWKLALAFLVGEFSGFCLFPVIYLSSLKYKFKE